MQATTQSQQAAAKLLEFSRQVCDAPTNRGEPYRQALALVQDIDKPLFDKAIAELRLAFLEIDQWRDPRGSTDTTRIEINSETFLEWMTRLDLHEVNTHEKNPEGELENRERWLLLDLAFGHPENLWDSFQVLRNNT